MGRFVLRILMKPSDGAAVGVPLGSEVGLPVGRYEGPIEEGVGVFWEGLAEGRAEGRAVGMLVVGCSVGWSLLGLGCRDDGDEVARVGIPVGRTVGLL